MPSARPVRPPCRGVPATGRRHGPEHRGRIRRRPLRRFPASGSGIAPDLEGQPAALAPAPERRRSRPATPDPRDRYRARPRSTSPCPRDLPRCAAARSGPTRAPTNRATPAPSHADPTRSARDPTRRCAAEPPRPGWGRPAWATRPGDSPTGRPDARSDAPEAGRRGRAPARVPPRSCRAQVSSRRSYRRKS